MGFPGYSVVKKPPDKQEMWAQSLGWEESLKEEMATHSSTLAEKLPRTEKAWQVIVHGLAELTQLTD